MTENASSAANPLDFLKWALAIGLLIAAIAGNYYYADVSILYRALGMVASVAVAGFIAASTEKGVQFIGFSKESRTEMRKVVWPTRQESTQTTMIVLGATVIVALLLWGLDGIIVNVVSFITNIGA
jgi:preprotein translocase subunit SecE